MTDYAADGDGYLWQLYPDPEHRVGIRAQQVRQERTGIHARLEILINGVDVAWSNFNVERDEDRVRLVNSAWHTIGKNGLGSVYFKEYLKHDVDTFCSGLWDAHVGTLRAELMTGDPDPKPPRFFLEPYILEEGGTMLFAPPGRGKSFVELLWAVAIDSGVCPWWPVTQARVYFLNLERGRQSVRARLGAVNRALGLDPDRPLLTLNARGRTLWDVLPSAKRDIREYGVKHVMLDSISRAGMGDLNENQSVNRIMDGLNALSPSWSAIAHTPRADESHAFGGIHQDAAADLMLQLLTQQEEDSKTLGIGLRITKDNDVGKRPMSILALEFEDVLRSVRLARPGEFPDIEAHRKQSMRDQVRQYLLLVGKATATEISDETGFARQSVATLLSKADTFQRVEKVGKEVFYGVSDGPGHA